MNSKDYISYTLVALNIAFVLFVFVSRYLTRHYRNNEDDSGEDPTHLN